jgi:hypothetical protein
VPTSSGFRMRRLNDPPAKRFRNRLIPELGEKVERSYRFFGTVFLEKKCSDEHYTARFGGLKCLRKLFAEVEVRPRSRNAGVRNCRAASID